MPARGFLPLKRRAVLGGLGATIATAGLAPARSLAAGGLTTTALTGSLSLIEGAGGNILVHTTDAGQVVVDSGAAEFRDAVLATLAELPGNGVAALFNTHWHAAQTGSNAALGSAGARIYAHEKTRLRLTTGFYRPEQDAYEAPLPDQARPTVTTRSSDSAAIGGTTVSYGYLIEAHTDGDLYVRFPDENVIAVGDVLAPVEDPEFDWFGGGWLGGRLDSIDRLLEISDADTRFVPGTGPAMTRDAVIAERSLYLQLFDIFVEHIRLGESSTDMLELGLHEGLSREFDDPARLFYDLHKGFWAHQNKLMHDIV